jgi:hypothetical protein
MCGFDEINWLKHFRQMNFNGVCMDPGSDKNFGWFDDNRPDKIDHVGINFGWLHESRPDKNGSVVDKSWLVPGSTSCCELPSQEGGFSPPS